MKVTLIQPYYHNSWEALGLGYIASYCKMYRSDVKFNFFQGVFDNIDTIIKGSSKSHIVGFSCTSPTVKDACYIAGKLKKINPKIITVMGGYHVTALKTLPKNIDQIVVGEGENAFLSILDGNREPIVYGRKMHLYELSSPDRKLIRNDRTLDLCEEMNGERIASFQSARGCPMSCAFCSEICMSGKFNRKTNPIRERNVNSTISEILRTHKKFNITKFKFVDPTFDFSEKHVMDFCMKKHLSGLDIPWECLVHANFMTERMMKALSLSNCNQINIGCESGSQRILNDIGKGVKIAKLKQVFSWAKKYGVNTRAFFIIGMPNETEEDIKLTEEFIDEVDPDVVGFSILCPYPGSSLYTCSYGASEWDRTDEYSNDIYSNRCFTNKELKMIQKRLTDKYSNKLCERQK